MAQLAGVINGLSERTTVMLCVNQTAQRSVYRGRKYIVKCLGAWYDKTCFHSAFEHLTGGDVFNLFNELPSRFLGVNNVRRIFTQLCRAVQFMHANCIAHLDIGVENMCIDNKGTVRLIDFGLAVQHPAVRQLLSCNFDFVKRTTDAVTAASQSQSQPQNATCTSEPNDPFGSPHIKLLHPNTHVVSTCRQSECKSCRQTFLRDRMPSPTEASFEVRRSMPFMCRPICVTKSSPGKPNCMAPEVFGRECFDAYAADCFSLGCVLYILSTGSRAFNVPTHDDDGFAKLYNNPRADEFMPSIIHSDARDLIRSLLVSQEQRPTIDVILQHPFLMKQ